MTLATQLSLLLEPTRSLEELLTEMKARTEKNHPRFYQPFAPEESQALRDHHAAQVPILAPDQPLLTHTHGIAIARGFRRVVIGDYGAYVEIGPDQINAAAFKPRFNGTPPRAVKYIWLTVIGDPAVKVYHQQATVAYADYQIGMYYVAPADVVQMVKTLPLELSPSEREFVSAPLILHGSGGWEVMVPAWLRSQLPCARLEYRQNSGDPNLACELDVVAYLITASLEQPLGSEWTHLYLHLAFKAMRRYGGAFTHLPTDEDDLTREADRPLSSYEQTLLDGLRSDIRSAQIKHAKKAHRTKPGC